jgi:hypothetical protein
MSLSAQAKPAGIPENLRWGCYWPGGDISRAWREAKTRARITSGQWTYTLDENWGKLPAGMKYGFGCGIVVDSKDRVYVALRSTNPCVAVFGRHGKLLETWSNDFAGNVGLSTAQIKRTAYCVY